MKNLNKILYLFLSLLAITQLCDIYAMENISPENRIYIQFSGQKTPTMVHKNFAIQFNTIKNMLEDIGQKTSPEVYIPLHNITLNTWNTITNIQNNIQALKNININELKSVLLAFNYLDPTKSPHTEKLFDNAIQEYVKRLTRKHQLTKNDFFSVGNDLNVTLIYHLIQQIIKPNIVNPSKIATSTTITGYHPTFSPDGNILAIRQKDVTTLISTTYLWDISDPENPSKITTIPGLSATFSPNDKILTVETEGKINLWNISDPKNPYKITTSTTIPGHRAIFSSKDKILAVKQRDGIKLWNISDPENPSEIRTSTPISGNYPTLSPDGNILATIQDKTIKLWDLSDHKNPYKITTSRPIPGNLTKFSPNDNILATILLNFPSFNHTINLWDISDPKNPYKITTSSPITGSTPIFSPHCKILIVMQPDKTIKLWNLSDPQNPSEIVTSTTITGWNPILSPDGNILATTQSDNIDLWSLYPPLLLDYLNNIQNSEQFLQSIITLCNMVKNPSQRTEENYNVFPNNIKEIIKKVLYLKKRKAETELTPDVIKKGRR